MCYNSRKWTEPSWQILIPLLRKLLKYRLKDFIRLCFDFQTIDITDVELVQPEQPTVDMRQADIIIKAEINGKQVIVHFEFQTTDSTETDMPLRMAGYIVRLIETYGLDVYFQCYLSPPGCRPQRPRTICTRDSRT